MKKGVDYPGVTIVFFCHDGKGNYLLSRRGAKARDEQGRWDVGGGGLEFGEKVEECLSKEIEEEYCADILKFEFLGYRDMHREHAGVKTHWLGLDFRVQLDPKQVKMGEPHKFDELGWFTIDSLPNPLHSQLGGALAKYKEKLI
ncbi:MAG TPA: NUDIX domain-containing protein [Candidatus Paceibacterota bacterium]